jgi:hypothetical protein
LYAGAPVSFFFLFTFLISPSLPPFFLRYKKQFTKLMRVILREYMPVVHSVTTADKSAVERVLCDLLLDYLNTVLSAGFTQEEPAAALSALGVLP